MNNKTVLIIEDKEAQRLALKESLELREFSVEEAGDVATARDLISKLGKKIDVMVLDLQLEDPDYPEVTGAHLGIEAMKAMKKLHAQSPEFLINTAYSEVIYYELALELGVAAYLHKNTSQNRIIQHIRGLALRRALSVENPEMAGKIRSIAESSRNQLEAVKQFCSEILIPEFKSCMGTPFILLLRDKERQKNLSCGGSADLPTRKR
jgi:DNA-binding NarL/FixJ family response regulator